MNEIDYARDWSGEQRKDENGNAFVLRRVRYSIDGRIAVMVNDIFGGHVQTILLDEWLSWEFAFEPKITHG